jgi:predicted O-methyltransferase YrrM
VTNAKRAWTLLKHWREAKTAFSTLSYLYEDGNASLDALGGLTEEEMKAVVSWATEEMGATVVEVGTLFGLTARELDTWIVGGRVIAVDNFSWNPFGLPPAVHEAFTRQILRGTGVELVNCSSEDWRKQVTGRIDMVFFDASHRYEDVKEECEWAKSAGIRIISGHDYGNPNPRFGVTRAVDEVFGKENVEVVGMCWRVRL